MRKPFIVSELSANHLGCLTRALELVAAAADAGADGFKLQTFEPEQMVGDPDYVLRDGPWAGRRLLDLYREAQTPKSWHARIFAECRAQGLVPFSSPFHPDDVDFLQSIDCPIYKIASFEIIDRDLVEACARTAKPLIISTGMASQQEILAARRWTHDCGNDDVTFLKCTSAYPARIADANLATMVAMRDQLGLDVGVSDHTRGHHVAAAAVALGATVVEKHLTLSRADGGPDAGFSLEPDEFREMVGACRAAAAAVGERKFGPGAEESASLELRRSLWFATDMQAGQEVSARNLRSARPGNGLSPSVMRKICGTRVLVDVRAGEPVQAEVLMNGAAL